MVKPSELSYQEFMRLYGAGLIFTHLDLEAELNVKKDKGSRMRFMADFRRCVEREGWKLDELVPSFPMRWVVYILPAKLYRRVRDCLLRHRCSKRIELVGRPDGSFERRVVKVARW